MNLLSNVKILPKVLGLIGILSAVSATIAYVGSTSLRSLSDATDVMERSANQALVAYRMSRLVALINRNEYAIAADPRPDSINRARQQIAAERSELAELRQRLAKDLPTEYQGQLARVDETLKAYEAELEDTFAQAAKVRSFEVNSDLANLHRSVESSRVVAERLITAVGSLSAALERNVVTVSAAATAEYKSNAFLMQMVAGIGIALGLILGVLIGRFGIAGPIRKIVATLQQLAIGNYNVTIEGETRRDEVGDVARAAVIFRENGLEKMRLQDEQVAAENRAAEEKRKAMNDLADQFDHAVGGIVGSVSSAATELEAAAQTLTSTAEETSIQSSAVASASEQMANNVQTVASATEEMSISVREIATQISRSTEIAQKAVQEAVDTAAKMQCLSTSTTSIGAIVNLIEAIAGPNQPACAQCNDRGGTSWRGGQGLRRCRGRG